MGWELVWCVLGLEEAGEAETQGLVGLGVDPSAQKLDQVPGQGADLSHIPWKVLSCGPKRSSLIQSSPSSAQAFFFFFLSKSGFRKKGNQHTY